MLAFRGEECQVRLFARFCHKSAGSGVARSARWLFHPPDAAGALLYAPCTILRVCRGPCARFAHPWRGRSSAVGNNFLPPQNIEACR